MMDKKRAGDLFADELYEQIFVHLSPDSLCKLSLVCKKFHRISKSAVLWEDAYLTFWRVGDERRAEQRKVRRWREAARAGYMRSLAKKSWQQRRSYAQSIKGPPQKMVKVEADEELDEAALCPAYITASQWSDVKSRRPDLPDFYSLFRQRISIDQVVLDAIEWQCVRDDNWWAKVDDLVSTYGDDMKDILHTLVCIQKRANLDQDDYDKQIVYNGNCTRRDFDFPKAFKARSPDCWRSESHHLSILHLAKDILHYIQCREAMRGLTSMRYTIEEAKTKRASWCALSQLSGNDVSTSKEVVLNAKQFENALCWLTMFYEGEGQEVSEELDVLAGSCALYLADRYPTSQEDARQCAAGICSFMASRGFQGATDVDFHNLDNNFIHLCLDETGRQSLPMTLVVIFCSIAIRLGLNATPTNTPMKIMAVVNGFVKGTQDAQDRFWVNVHGEGQILDRNGMLRPFSTPTPQAEAAILSASTPLDCCTRSARNIITSVQRAQVMPGFDSLTASKIEGSRMTEEVSAESIRRHPDRYFEKVMHSRRNLFNPRRTIRIGQQKQLKLVSCLWDYYHDQQDLEYSFTSAEPTKFPFFPTAGRFQRVHHWSEAVQHAAMHAASNALIRCEDQLGERGLQWAMSLTQTHFPFDILALREEILEARGHGADEVRSPYGRADEHRQEMVLTKYEWMMKDVGKPDTQRRTWEIYTEDEDGNVITNKVKTSPSGDEIFSVGTVFVHGVYFYRAVIIGWDEICTADDDWIDNMAVDQLANGGRDQPFYRSLVEDGSMRYVAHCNIRQAQLVDPDDCADVAASRSLRGRIEPLVLLPDELERLMNVRGVGEYFRCASYTDGYERTLRLLPNAAGLRIYPDDV